MSEQQAATANKYEFTRDWFSRHETSWWSHLGQLAGRPSVALEIGSLEGRSAIWMLDHILVHQDSRLFCIDLFPNAEIEQRFDRNIAASGQISKVTKLKGPSWRHLRALSPEQFDFIYIDGSHHGQNVLEDAILSYRLLRVGGILIFDDYLWRGKEYSVFPKDAVDAFLNMYQDCTEVLARNWQICICKSR